MNIIALENLLKGNGIKVSQRNLFPKVKNLLLEGKISRKTVIGLNGWGPKSWNELLDLLGLEESVSVKRNTPQIQIGDSLAEKIACNLDEP